MSATLDDVSPLAVKLAVRRTLTRDHRVVVTTVPRGGGSPGADAAAAASAAINAGPTAKAGVVLTPPSAP